jgi:hypothetical protein
MAQPCPVHGTPLLGGYAICMGGYPERLVGEYFHACALVFPRANAVSYGSCAARDAGTRKRVKYCTKCRDELLSWCQQQGRLRDWPSGFLDALVAHLSAAGDSPVPA